MSERFKNQARLIDQSELAARKIVVIGAGAIGSYVVQALAKMGAKDFVVYDDDTIEEHNVSNQLYPLKYVGVEKTTAITQLAKDFGGMEVEVAAKGRWTQEVAVDGDIIICAVDNMDTRKLVWDHYKSRPIGFYVEGRMGAQVYRVYGINPLSGDDVSLYGNTLYTQSEASPEPCGEKSIIYCVLAVAATMASQVKQFLMKEDRPTEVTYDAVNYQMQTKFTTRKEREVIEA